MRFTMYTGSVTKYTNKAVLKASRLVEEHFEAFRLLYKLLEASKLVQECLEASRHGFGVFYSVFRFFFRLSETFGRFFGQSKEHIEGSGLF